MSNAATWAPPRVSGPLVTFRGRNPDASDLEKEARAISEAGFQRGRSEGLAAAAAEIQAKQRQLDERIVMLNQVLIALSRPLDRLDEYAAQELTTLAIRIGGELARRDLGIEPGQIVEVIRHAARELPLAQRDLRVHLNPGDCQAVRGRLDPARGETAWTLIDDPSVSRGGCRVIVGDSRIDATLEERLRRLIEQSLGGGALNGIGDITAELDSEEGL